MSDVSGVLSLLTRDELLAVADHYGVTLPNRPNKATIVDVLTASVPALAEAALGTLRRDRLQQLCTKLGLDTRGRSKEVLIARILNAIGASGPQMGPWRRIEINNYRSIESACIELSPFSVLVGPNGSGKSNITDAFLFVRDIASDAKVAVERRGGIAALRRWNPDKPLELSVDIRVASTRAGLDTDYIRHRFMLASKLDGTWRFDCELVARIVESRTYWDIFRENNQFLLFGDLQGPTWMDMLGDLNPTASMMTLLRQLSRFAELSGFGNVMRIRLSPDEMRRPQLVTEDVRLSESGHNIAAAYRSLSQEAKDQVLLSMQRIVPGLVSIAVETLDQYLLLKFLQRQTDGREARFSAAAMSEGAIRALGILVAAQQLEQGMLLIIEEPEVSIHVGAAQLLFEALKEASARGAVLITTHSADLLDAAHAEDILVCAYRDGITHVGPLASSQREVIRDGLFSVAELIRSEPLRIEGESPEVVKRAGA